MVFRTHKRTLSKNSGAHTLAYDAIMTQRGVN